MFLVKAEGTLPVLKGGGRRREVFADTFFNFITRYIVYLLPQTNEASNEQKRESEKNEEGKV